MKNVTFSANEDAITAARARARAEGTTLNEAFRRWLDEYASRPSQGEQAMKLLDELLEYAGTGGQKFTREEMNER